MFDALKERLSEEEKEYLEERMKWDKNWLSRRRDRFPNGKKVSIEYSLTELWLLEGFLVSPELSFSEL